MSMSVDTRADSFNSGSYPLVDPSPISVATLTMKPSLPPLNLGSVPRKSQADYEGVEVVRKHTCHAVRSRRRSMSDLTAQRQRDYDLLVKELGIAPKPLKEEAAKILSPRLLPPVTIVSAAAAGGNEAPCQTKTLTLPKPLVQRHSFYDKVSA